MRTILQKEIDTICQTHMIWIESKGKSGKCAVLEKVHLKEIDFQRKNLQKIQFINSVLDRCTFYKADLTQAIFLNSNLENSDFTESNLNGTIFRRSLLENTVFTNACLLNSNFGKTALNPIDLKICNQYDRLRPIFFHKSTYYNDDNYLRIGSRGFSLKEWRIYFKQISVEEEYTMDEKKYYKELILKLAGVL